MSKRDLNDKLRAGDMPKDPFAGDLVSDDVLRIYTFRDLLQASMKYCFDRSPIVFSTFGHPEIDEATGGARAGEVTFLGADSSWGKSSYGLMVADENSRIGRRVLVVSAEDSMLTFSNRLMRRRAKVNASNMRHRRLTPEELERIAAVAAEGLPIPVFIDARGKSVEWLASRIKQSVNEHQIDLLVCDYVGSFSKEKHLNDQGQRGTTTYIARTLVDVCKTCTPEGIAGLILTQITLDDKNPIPGKYSLRDSKDQVHMAENVLVGFVAPEDIPEFKGGPIVAHKGERCLKVAKAKEGVVGKSLTVLPWNETTACFDADARPARPSRSAAEHDNRWGNWGNFDNERAP